MPSAGKRKAKPDEEDVERAAQRKRSLAESRAAAKEWSLKRKSAAASASPTEGTASGGAPTNSKKPRHAQSPSPSKDDKAEARRLSRLRAQEYAQSISSPPPTHGGGNLEPSSAADGSSETESDDGPDHESMDTDTDTGTAGLMEPPPDRKPHEPLPRVASPPLDPTPPMPVVSVGRGGEINGGPFAAPRHPPQLSSVGGLGEARDSINRRRRTSFLSHADKKEGAGTADPAMPESLWGPHSASLPEVKKSGLAAGQAENRDTRQSFLERAKKKQGAGAASPVPPPGSLRGSKGTSTMPGGTRVVTPGQQDRRGRRQSFLEHATVNGEVSAAERPVIPAEPHREGEAPQQEDTKAARPNHAAARGRSQGWAKVLAYSCTVVLAPLMLSCLILGVLVPAWPHARLAAGHAWNALYGLGAIASSRQKCFVASNEDASICKEGTEATVCPSSVACALGSILHCPFLFEKANDGSCVVSKAVTEEAKLVVDALRRLTVEEQCKGRGLLMRCSSRSFMTLTDAAIIAKKETLGLLAYMPAGNVAGLLDLEGDAAQTYGGGEGSVAEGASGSGSERIARLSEATASTVHLPWKCRARLFAGSLVLDNWQVFITAYALLMAVLYLDVRRLTNYRRHVKVCAMRDESYKALLDHTAKDSSPMQTSHIQDFVGDSRRSKGERGSTAQIQKNVRKLWACVEKEVEHDTRIRRSYKNIRGQHNVPCWQWLGPSTATFDSIGGLDPGPAPRLWLLRWMNQPLAPP